MFCSLRTRRPLLSLVGLSSLLLLSLLCFPATVVPGTVGLAPAGHGSGDGLGEAEESSGKAVPKASTVPTVTPVQQHVAGTGADRWHSAGYRGRGVKVAVLDTGFRGYHAFLGKTLPTHVTAHSFRADGNMEARDSQHGILCAEVVHALAPEAEIILADWDVGREDEFLAAVRWARAEGARVITCSVIAPSWSDGEGGGEVHRDLTALLSGGPRDLVCFASAGNTTERHWSGSFQDGGNRWHAWKAGQTDNVLRPLSDERVHVELYGRAGGLYELVVLDESGREAGRSATDPNRHDRLSAAVRFFPEAGHTYRVRVRHMGGTAGAFHVTTTFGTLDLTTPIGNVCFPGDGPEVVAVGAVDSNGQRQTYSAVGADPAHVKPDLVATVPFPVQTRRNPFGGTSAASPQAAALAALWLSRHPDWNAEHVRAEMRRDATDLLTPGPDCETGYGLAHLPPQ